MNFLGKSSKDFGILKFFGNSFFTKLEKEARGKFLENKNHIFIKIC
jgi:hypothetical protein